MILGVIPARGGSKGLPKKNLKTIKYFAEHGWIARDLHAGNVMQRADTNQLVIVDVGLFVVERDFR